LIGETISHYRILEKLGEGGMGIVYKARDTRLDRFVALKVLLPEKTSDQERCHRFIHEAKAASALEHPNIVTIYEILEHDGHNSIVMQYVPGKTLRDLLSSGPMPLNEALRIGIQLADALACAHRRGIIHRDLKPENVMVTDGQVKVLDFGLAKLLDDTDPEATVSFGRTQTEEGHIVGTISYMSPEQAQARPVDSRSDIFSFGCVLYEIVTGRRAFRGENSLATLAAIVRDEPVRANKIVPNVPPDLDRLIWRTLRKDPERRWQSMADVRIALAEIKEESDSGASPFASQALPPSRRLKRYQWAMATLALAGIVLGAAAWMRLRNPPSTKPPAVIPFTSYAGREMTPSLSPDGNQVAFSWDGEKGGNFDIYVKLVGTGAPLRLTTDPAEDSYPVWSPDGRFIAFVRGGRKAIVVPALGGFEREICDASPAGLAWSPDGQFLAVVTAGKPSAISFVSVESGEARQVTTPPAGSQGDTRPALSPDGAMLAFLRHPRALVSSDIHVLRLHSGAAPTGDPLRLTFDDRQISSLAWTPEGDKLVFSSARAGTLSLWSIGVRGRGGGPERLQVAGENVEWLSISHKRNRMAYARTVVDQNIWRAPGPTAAASGNAAPEQLIASTQAEGGPQYSPDGARIAFSSTRSGHGEIWICESDGSNPRQVTSFAGPDVGTPRWSPDGRRIAFDTTKEENRNIYVVGVDGSVLRRLTTETSDEVRPSWSRDGRWIYFGSDRTGTFQIWKAPAEGGAAVQVTKAGGREAFEASDGNLYYAQRYSSRVPQLSGIWRVPIGGGEEVRVLQEGRQGHWALFDRGIVLLNLEDPSIDYFPFGQKSPTHLVALPRNVIPRSGFDGPSFGISPDGKWVLYVQRDRVDSDIMLVDSFQ
jgi:serine/threonine protein kinase/Tol biopolymer transport system component